MSSCERIDVRQRNLQRFAVSGTIFNRGEREREREKNYSKLLFDSEINAEISFSGQRLLDASLVWCKISIKEVIWEVFN